MTKFFKLTESIIGELSHQLNSTETLVFLLLKAKNPFCDAYKKTTTQELADTLNLSVRTIRRAIKSIKDKNLIEFNIIEFEYKTNKLENELNDADKFVHVDDKFGTARTNLSMLMTNLAQPSSESTEIASLQPSTDSKTIKTFLDCKEENEEKNKEKEMVLDVKSEVVSNFESDDSKQLPHKSKMVLNQTILTENKENLTSQQEEKKGAIVPQVEQRVEKRDPYFNQPRNPNRRKQLEDWIPEGPWKVYSKSGHPCLDWKFIEYTAQNLFVKEFGDDSERAFVKATAYFRNDVNRLPAEFEAYQRHSLKAASSIQAYTAATGNVQEKDVQKLESVSTAFKSLPEQYHTTDRPTQFTPTVAQTPELPTPSIATIVPSEVTSIEERPIAKNTKEYRAITGGDDEATLEQKRAFFAAMKNLAGGRGMMARNAKKEPKSRLEIWEQQLHDPILQPMVIREVQNSNSHTIEYNENGYPYIVQLQKQA